MPENLEISPICYIFVLNYNLFDNLLNYEIIKNI
jgi:hypothetical protein